MRVSKLLPWTRLQALSKIASLALVGHIIVRGYSESPRTSNCDHILTHGRWSHDRDSSPNRTTWHPFGCTLQNFNSSSTQQCLDARTIYFLGDSTARQIFWAFATKLGGDSAKNASHSSKKHIDISYGLNNTLSLHYVWDPFLNSTRSMSVLLNAYLQYQSLVPMHEELKIIIIGVGLWHARYLGDLYQVVFNSTLNQIIDIAGSAHAHINTSSSWKHDYPWLRSLYFIPPPTPDRSRLDHDRALMLNSERLHGIYDILYSIQHRDLPQISWSLLEMTDNHTLSFEDDGLHMSQDIADLQASSLLNHLCDYQPNLDRAQNYTRCCTPKWRFSWSKSEVVLTALCLTAALFRLSQRAKLSSEVSRRGITPLEVISLVMIYCHAADRTSLLGKALKITDARLFTTFCILFALVALGPPKRIKIGQAHQLPYSGAIDPVKAPLSDLFMSREHTDEWKGWMQAVILLYHYFGMSKIFWIYRIARVLVGSYLFLTGYGHTTYFLTTRDFNLRRTCAVLLRLNLLSCLLSVIMNNPYDFYYFPGLVSLWYLIIYLTLFSWTKRSLSLQEALLRLFTSATILRFCVTPARIQPFVTFLNLIKGPHIDLHELIFRVRLDMNAPYIGMMLAIVTNRGAGRRTTGQGTPHEADNTVCHGLWSIASLSILVSYFLVTGSFADKVAYNTWHPVLSIVPILAYVHFRHSIPTMAHSVSRVSMWLGRCSLETFVLQYHIWLAGDTKNVLRLDILDIPKLSGKTTVSSLSFWLETAVVTMLFLWTSHQCSKATTALVNSFIPSEQVSPGDFAKEISRVHSEADCITSRKLTRKISQILSRPEGKAIIVLALLWLLKNFK